MRRNLGIALLLLALPGCYGCLRTVELFGGSGSESSVVVTNDSDLVVKITLLYKNIGDGTPAVLPLIHDISFQWPYACSADSVLNPGEKQEFWFTDSDIIPSALFIALPDGGGRIQELSREESVLLYGVCIKNPGALPEAPPDVLRRVEMARRSSGRDILYCGPYLLGPLWILGFISWLFLPRKPRSPSSDSAAPLR